MTALNSLSQKIGQWANADPANMDQMRAYRDKQWSTQAENTPTGLIGYENAVNQGTRNAIAANNIAGSYQHPYMQGGAGASDLQSALSGAMGPEAQQQAYANYNASPGMDYALQQSERALTRNAAATGGLGGGNVQQALQQNAIGLAQQDYQNQFDNLGTLSNRGANAANIAGSYEGRNSDIFNTQGLNIGNARLNTGLNIANTLAGVSDGLANYNNAAGSGVADITANGAVDIAVTQGNAGNQANQNNQWLGTLIGNIATGAASNVAGLPQPDYQNPNLMQGAGQFISATGQLLQGYGGAQPAPSIQGQNGAMNQYTTGGGGVWQ